MKRIVVLLLAGMLALPLFAAEPKKFKIAVMDVEDLSGTLDPNLLKSATEYLRSKLVATGLYVVIDKTRQQEKLKGIIKDSKKESYQECFDKNCQIPLGQALAADNILRSSITFFGGMYSIATELVDLAKEATVAGLVADFDGSPKGMRDAINKLIEDMLAKSQAPATVIKAAEPETLAVQFESATPGATLSVDGKEACKKIPCFVDVTKGTHAFELKAAGHQTRKESVAITESRLIKWDLVANAPIAKPVPVVKPQPVIVQPKPQPKIEPQPVAKAEPAPAPVEVKKEVPAPKGPEPEVTRPYLWWGVGTLGVAAAVFGVAWYFSAEVGNNLDKRNDLMQNYYSYPVSERPTVFQKAVDYEDKAKFNDTMRIVMFSVSGAAAVAGTVLAIWQSDWSQSDQTPEAPKVSFYFDGSSVYAGASFSY